MAFYAAAITMSCRTSKPRGRALIFSRYIPLQSCPTLFTKQDSHKGILKFLGSMGGRMPTAFLGCLYCIPLLLCNNRIMPTFIQIIILILYTLFRDFTIFDNFFHRLSSPTNFSQIHFIIQDIHHRSLAPFAFSCRDM